MRNAKERQVHVVLIQNVTKGDGDPCYFYVFATISRDLLHGNQNISAQNLTPLKPLTLNEVEAFLLPLIFLAFATQAVVKQNILLTARFPQVTLSMCEDRGSLKAVLLLDDVQVLNSIPKGKVAMH